MTEKTPRPNDLVAEIAAFKAKAATSNPTQHEVDRLLVIIEDLSFFRYYGFRHSVFEELLAEDPGAMSIYDKIEEEEKRGFTSDPGPGRTLRTGGL